MKEKLIKWGPLVLLLIFLAAIYVPRWWNHQAAMRFGEQLFSHPLPENAEIVSTDGVKDEEGGYTAAILMKTDLTSEELEAFYADVDYAPAKEGQSIRLDAKALTEADLDVLKTAKLYEEGAQYQFIYIYSN